MKTKNKNFSDSYEKSYGQVAEPELGARTPAGKDSKDNLDSQKNPALKFEKVRQAKEDVGTVRAAHQKQDGEDLDNAPHSNSGCGKSE